MSGKPYLEGVTKIIESLRRCDELAAEIVEMESTTARLASARAAYNRLSEEIRILLDSMDLQAQGNYGFGGRMGWFLAEMRRQLAADLERHRALRPERQP